MAQQQPPRISPALGLALQQPPSPRPPHAAVRPISPALGVGCCSTPARASNLVGAILAGVLSIVLAPAIFALVVSPIVLLGLACSSHARTWLRVDWSPCVKLLAVLVDIALAVIAVGTHLLEHIVLQPVALLAYSLLRAPVALPWNPQPDAEAPACAHSRGGLGASAASSAARARARRPIRPTYSGRRPESSEGDRYRGHASVWEALEGDGQKVLPGDVRLLSLRWLVEHADKGEALPRRQSVPEEAFLDVARLKEIEGGAKRRLNIFGLITAFTELGLGGGISSILSTLTSVVRRKRNPDGLLPIISISYCWLEAAHPDREGHQLQLLCRKLQSLHGGRGLLAACRDYGFTDMVSCLLPLPTATPSSRRYSLPGSRRVSSSTGPPGTRRIRRCGEHGWRIEHCTRGARTKSERRAATGASGWCPSGARMRRAGPGRRRRPLIACSTALCAFCNHGRAPHAATRRAAGRL